MPIRGEKFTLFFYVRNFSKLTDHLCPREERCDSIWRLSAERDGAAFRLCLSREKIRDAKTLKFDVEIFFTKPTMTSIKKKTWPEKSDDYAYLDYDTVLRKHTLHDELTVKVEIELKYDAALYALHDFSVPTDMTDVVLIAEGTKFHVSKIYLANLSKYFHCIFFASGYRESGQNEIDLPEENADYLQQFLEVAYHKSGVTVHNVKNILKLSNYYQTTDLMKKCEEALIAFPIGDFDRREMLLLADQYELQDLTATCVSRMRTIDEIKQVAPCSVSILKEHTVKKILQRALDIAPPMFCAAKRARHN